MNFKSVRSPLLIVTILLIGGGSWFAWQRLSAPSPEARYRQQEVKTGDLTQNVSANGSLSPVTLVNVGTQVSGTVRKLHVDFNDVVKAGQILAELDDSILKAAAALPEVAGHDNVLIYDPVPMRMARLANLERGQLLVESPSRPALQAFLPQWREAIEGLKAPSKLRWHIEVDPLEF